MKDQSQYCMLVLSGFWCRFSFVFFFQNSLTLVQIRTVNVVSATVARVLTLDEFKHCFYAFGHMAST